MLDIAYTHSGRLAKADYGTKSETLRQTYEYDKKGQLLAVKDADGNAVESYAYDKAGNMLKKQILRSGRAGAPRTPQTETFQWDGLALIQRGDEQFMNEPHIGNAPKKLCFGGKPQANVVERITVYWQVKMRKWVDE